MSVFDGSAGLKDWQWLFLIEAIPAIIAGVVRLALAGRRPGSTPRWLQADEKRWLAERLEGEEAARTRASATRSARR